MLPSALELTTYFTLWYSIFKVLQETTKTQFYEKASQIIHVEQTSIGRAPVDLWEQVHGAHNKMIVVS